MLRCGSPVPDSGSTSGLLIHLLSIESPGLHPLNCKQAEVCSRGEASPSQRPKPGPSLCSRTWTHTVVMLDYGGCCDWSQCTLHCLLRASCQQVKVLAGRQSLQGCMTDFDPLSLPLENVSDHPTVFSLSCLFLHCENGRGTALLH